MPERVWQGQCEQCRSRALVQSAWIRYGPDARQRTLCRRCWRNLARGNNLLSPQQAGKVRARMNRLIERAARPQQVARTCPHRMNSECGPCRRARQSEANRRVRASFRTTNATTMSADQWYSMNSIPEFTEVIAPDIEPHEGFEMPEINEEPDEVLF